VQWPEPKSNSDRLEGLASATLCVGICLAPKASLMLALGNAPGIHVQEVLSAESAIHLVRIQVNNFSIPYIALVELNAVLLQKIPVFLLKASNPVMLFVIVDVSENRIELAGADRKRAITTLPEKPAIFGPEALDPF
jgi:hypothetical protein